MMNSERPADSAKNHWYDGTFFDLCVAPNQDPVFAAVRAVIEPGSTVLDVGCGTGRLVFQLAGHCRMVCGIDPSSRNINRARALYRRQGSPSHLTFESASLGAYLSHFRERYDIGVISFVLHEVEETARVPMLQMLSGAVRTVILADYRVPRRRRLADAATEVVEFVAGIEHYRGFRSFIRRGGLTELVREAGLRNLGEQPCSQRTAQVLRAAGTVP
jgi:SAM-dependent methyltransferase